MHPKQGFTVIELMLAMAFIAMLMLGVAVLTVQIGKTYTRGLTIRQVNTAGQQLANDMQRAVQDAQVIDLDTNYVLFTRQGSPIRVYTGAAAYTHAGDANIMAGRFCLGNRSYVWNAGSFIDEVDSGTAMASESPNSVGSTVVHYARVAGDLCGAGDGTTLASYPALSAFASSTEELLQVGDRNLAIHKIVVNGNTTKGLYAISLTVGTNKTSTFETGGDKCKPPADVQSDQDYCAVNRFDIVARTVSVVP